MHVDKPDTSTALDAEDRELVDLLTAVLVDPNLETDLIMRLHREVSAILHAAREDLYGRGAEEPSGSVLQVPDDHLPDLLTAVLVDPNLYTDLRMRLHREIRLVLTRERGSRPGSD
jgi:hypothetical protein